MIVVLLGIFAFVVVERLVSQSMMSDEAYKRAMENSDNIEMRDLRDREYAEVAGRVLLPQSC